MEKPVHILWKSAFPNESSLSEEKRRYVQAGFWVAVFEDNPAGVSLPDVLSLLADAKGRTP